MLTKFKINLSTMNNLVKSRELLKKYFKETPKEILNQKFEKFNLVQFEGLSVVDYFSALSKEYAFFDKGMAFDKVTNEDIDAEWIQPMQNEQTVTVVSNIL